jgi:DUF1365 family protein
MRFIGKRGGERPLRQARAAAAHGDRGTSLAIMHGEVMHARERPTRNAFRYPAFCLRLPLGRLDELDACGVRWNRRGLVAFFERDHGPRDGTSLMPWIRALLDAERVRADGDIVLYTFPRMLGYVFNPVSFWVCHASDGTVGAVLAEVNNTFGEHHLYLIAHDDGTPIVSGETIVAKKAFHVSPFCRVAGSYAFRFHFDSTRWLARIDHSDDAGAGVLLRTHVCGRAEPLTRGAAGALVFRYPAFTLGVIARIHWQALKLWLARVPFVSKPRAPEQALTRSGR